MQCKYEVLSMLENRGEVVSVREKSREEDGPCIMASISGKRRSFANSVGQW